MHYLWGSKKNGSLIFPIFEDGQKQFLVGRTWTYFKQTNFEKSDTGPPTSHSLLMPYRTRNQAYSSCYFYRILNSSASNLAEQPQKWYTRDIGWQPWASKYEVSLLGELNIEMVYWKGIRSVRENGVSAVGKSLRAEKRFHDDVLLRPTRCIVSPSLVQTSGFIIYC